ncbi:hypothetical protein BQ8482_480088 [Mesorhizobium delmotii]|uniref:Uncharacterized protein n=1 Tax=Mesorhizobium delmotii TaxID=1631247 RepID=A0A2P9ATV9_9HYPH|nr:hypothetical protein BQ8482_480088 [Mesorhizobium delmotii]
MLCDGFYAVDFGMVLICANDPPPRRVFCFGAVHGKVSNRNTIPFAANQIAPRWRIFLNRRSGKTSIRNSNCLIRPLRGSLHFPNCHFLLGSSAGLT